MENGSNYIGRKKELAILQKLRHKKTASLVCLTGRRRIGKSRLIEEFSRSFKSYTVIQGIAPTEKSTNQSQLEYFSLQISNAFNVEAKHYKDWSFAFRHLAELTLKGERLILLDEISWMGSKDDLFSSKLKDAWDLFFKKNKGLILVLCGSVSSWIDANILKNTNFVGRVSLQINLQELSLPECEEFLKKNKCEFSAKEKILILSVTGGVPKYLEEILSTESALNNINRLCFQKNGFLFNEYEKIFSDIFGRRAGTFEKIIKACLTEKLSIIQLSKKLKLLPNSELSEQVYLLEQSGFLSRDFYFNSDGKVSKFSHLRVKDNYLRFYLKNILPLKAQIESNAKSFKGFSELSHFESTLGLQFENLLLSNKELIHDELEIPSQQILSSAPHFQKKNTKNKGGCQIDLLIHTELDLYYLCEFKCKKVIDKSVIKEVEKKKLVLTRPKGHALKTVLIYEGELYPPHEDEINQYFLKTISFQELLK